MFRTRLVGLLALVLVGGLPGCATLGHRATEGAQQAVREDKARKTAEEQALDDALARRQAEQTARGFLDALTQPASPSQSPSAMASGEVPAPVGPGLGGSGLGGSVVGGSGQLNALGSSLATRAARSFGAELERQLGADGTGPLGQSLSAAAGQIASNMVKQSRDELGSLFPECAGLEGEGARACRDAQVARLGESFTHGAAQGVLQALRPWLLVIAFAGGLLVGLLVFLSLSVVRLNRVTAERAVGYPRERRPA
jgi:hypothetical protein